jgi:hypothetical protein
MREYSCRGKVAEIVAVGRIVPRRDAPVDRRTSGTGRTPNLLALRGVAAAAGQAALAAAARGAGFGEGNATEGRRSAGLIPRLRVVKLSAADFQVNLHFQETNSWRKGWRSTAARRF